LRASTLSGGIGNRTHIPQGLLAGGCGSYGDGGVERQCREMGGGIGENEHDFHRIRFPDALARLPLAGSPMVFSLSWPSAEREGIQPHPSREGRDACGQKSEVGGGGVGVSEWFEGFEFEPTSLKGGEGVIAGGLKANRCGEGESGGGGMVEDDQISTVMGLM